MTFLEILLTGIGFAALMFGGSYAIVTAWTAFSESAERKRKDAQLALKLLAQIEANTARPEPSTIDPS